MSEKKEMFDYEKADEDDSNLFKDFGSVLVWIVIFAGFLVVIDGLMNYERTYFVSYSYASDPRNAVSGQGGAFIEYGERITTKNKNDFIASAKRQIIMGSQEIRELYNEHKDTFEIVVLDFQEIKTPFFDRIF